MGKDLIVGIVVAACLIGVVLFLGLTFLATNESKLTNKSVDYSQPENWLSLPSSPDKAVDVFYLYPTSYQPNTSDPCICDIDNPSMLSGAKSAYARQVTAFAPVANIYSPYYRQASTRCRMNLLTTEQEQIVGSTPTSDALAAFDYYIQHYNNGRPFILAGHSQGSNVMANLLSQYMKDHPDVYKRMVAAYVIGYSITPTYLANNPHLKFAEGPNDTGVIISYNTEGPFVNGTNPVTMPGGIAINPITWSRTEELAPASESLGSFLPGKNGTGGKVQNYADAQINKTKGVIICDSVNESAIAPIDALAGFPEGVYHSFDYPFYYYNLQANAVNRINHYFNRSFSTPTNYSLPAHWLSLPSSPGKAVDVFYLYPTAWQKTNASDPNICDVDNPSMIKGSNAAFAEQATAFEPIANIYAPYYRQVYTASLLLPLQEQETLLKNATIPDVTAAFDYYINHYNNGRPFILAGHSQGSNALIYILSDYMKANPDVYKRMVAAYVIGYSITPTYLANNPHLKFAEGPNDTGVIVSYNTEAPVLNGTDPVVLPGALVINPITWTRTEELATANQSLGSYLPNQNGTDVLVKNYADAQINMTKGALICSTANPNTLAPGNVAVGKGIYHTFDYLFYYYNIRANVADRINHYFNQLS